MFDSEQPYYIAALSHFQSKRDEAMAILDMYFENSVGVGDHSNILEEIVKWTKVLAESEECINTLKAHEQDK